MTIITEQPHSGEYLLWEADRQVARDRVTLTGGQLLYPGTVLGKITASGKVTQLDPDASDGSEDACGVLYYRVNARSNDQPTIMTCRQCEVASLALIWPDGISDNQKAAAIAQLTTLGVVVRQ